MDHFLKTNSKTNKIDFETSIYNIITGYKDADTSMKYALELKIKCEIGDPSFVTIISRIRRRLKDEGHRHEHFNVMIDSLYIALEDTTEVESNEHKMYGTKKLEEYRTMNIHQQIKVCKRYSNKAGNVRLLLQDSSGSMIVYLKYRYYHYGYLHFIPQKIYARKSVVQQMRTIRNRLKLVRHKESLKGLQMKSLKAQYLCWTMA